LIHKQVKSENLFSFFVSAVLYTTKAVKPCRGGVWGGQMFPRLAKAGNGVWESLAFPKFESSPTTGDL